MVKMRMKKNVWLIFIHAENLHKILVACGCRSSEINER